MTYEEYRVRHLQRFPLNTTYPAMINRTIEIIQKLGGGTLVIDATGVGRPVVDLFWEHGLTPWAITITGGNNATCAATEAIKKKGMFVTPSVRDQLTWSVPKRDLVGVLSVSFQNHVLKISSKLPDAKTLTDELLNFKVKINAKTAHDSYEAWREGQHDDLVLSVALALWVAVHHGSTSPYYFGLDLGQASDFTALSIIEGASARTPMRPYEMTSQVPMIFTDEEPQNPIRAMREGYGNEHIAEDLPRLTL